MADYIERFGYRRYEGKLVPRWKRIVNLVRFELTSTWYKSTFGKVLLIIILIMGFMGVTFAATSLSIIAEEYETPEEKEQILEGILNGHVGSSLSISHSIAANKTFTGAGSFFLGFLLIALFAIVGSGLIADDNQGQVLGLYLSKIQRNEYIMAKFLSIVLYINFFLTIPLLILGALYVQGLEFEHIDYFNYYAGIILYGLLSSLFIGAAVLFFSSVAEKRNYASLAFFLTYLISSMFGSIVWSISPSNEYLLLISPSNLLSALAYICLGDYEVWSHVTDKKIFLNDGSGLEFFHIFGTVCFLIIALFFLLILQMKRLFIKAE